MAKCEINGNYIVAERIKSRKDKKVIRAYRELLACIKEGVCNPKMHILENEASEEFKKAIKVQCKLEMVPPDVHRRNITG